MLRRRTQIEVYAALVAGLAACVLSVGAQGSSGSHPTLFDYNRAAPLDLVQGKTTTSGAVVRQELTFTGAGSDRLVADFLHPAAGEPWPLVIWTPGYGGDRLWQLSEASALARAGVASLLVDPPPGAYKSTGCDASKDLANYVRYVISRRRAIDVAETLSNVDAKRIAAAGFSYGAEITGTLAGLEYKRVVAFALSSGRGHDTGSAPSFCPSLRPKRAFDAYLAIAGVVDPVNWVPLAAHSVFLLQNGTRDGLTPKDDVLALYAAVKGPKELRWYDADHPLNAAATSYHQQWLLRRLVRR